MDKTLIKKKVCYTWLKRSQFCLLFTKHQNKEIIKVKNAKSHAM